MLIKDNPVIESFKSLNQALTSHTLSTLGQILIQYSKLFLNKKKLTLEESCGNLENGLSINYCKVIGQIGK